MSCVKMSVVPMSLSCCAMTSGNLLSRATRETLSSGVPEKSVHVNLSAIEEQLGGGGGGYDGCGGGDCGMRLGASLMEAEG